MEHFSYQTLTPTSWNMLDNSVSSNNISLYPSPPPFDPTSSLQEPLLNPNHAPRDKLPPRSREHFPKTQTTFPYNASDSNHVNENASGNTTQRRLNSALTRGDHIARRFLAKKPLCDGLRDHQYDADPSSVNTSFNHVLISENMVSNSPRPSTLGLMSDRNAYHRLQSQCIRYEYGDNAENFNRDVLSKPGQVIFFTTSLTSDFHVRDRTRMLQSLLEIKMIPYHTMDVANNNVLRKILHQIHTAGAPPGSPLALPVLCVNDTYIGDAESIQAMVDMGTFDECLQSAGFINPLKDLSHPEAIITKVSSTVVRNDRGGEDRVLLASSPRAESSSTFGGTTANEVSASKTSLPFRASRPNPLSGWYGTASGMTTHVQEHQMTKVSRLHDKDSHSNDGEQHNNNNDDNCHEQGDRMELLVGSSDLRRIDSITVVPSPVNPFQSSLPTLSSLTLKSSGPNKIVIESILKPTSSFHGAKVKPRPASFRKGNQDISTQDSSQTLTKNEIVTTDSGGAVPKLPSLVPPSCAGKLSTEEAFREREVTILEPIRPCQDSKSVKLKQNGSRWCKMLRKLAKIF